MGNFAKKKFVSKVRELYGSYANFTIAYNKRFGVDKKLDSVKKWGQVNNPNAPSRRDLLNVALMLRMTVEELLTESGATDKTEKTKNDLKVFNVQVIPRQISDADSKELLYLEIMPISVKYFKTQQNEKNLRVMQVDSYHMTPMLYPETWLIFDISKTKFDGDGLYIICFNDILMVKLLQINKQGFLRVVSVNRNYESYEVQESDQNTLRIFGKVVKTIF